MHLEYLNQFVIGGFVVTGTNYLIKKFNTKIGALFWSLPYSLFPVILYMWSRKESNKEIAKLGKNGCKYSIVTLLFLLAFYLTLDKMSENDNGVIYALMAAILIWCIVSFIFYYWI